MYRQIQCRPSPRIWERRGGILTDDDTPGGTLGGRSILTERFQTIRRDKDQPPSSPVLTGLYGWYEASLGVTVDMTGEVQSWDDQSGLGNTIARQIGSVSIIPVSNALNGKPIVRFVPNGVGGSHLNRNTVNNSPAGPIVPGGTFSGMTQVHVMRCRANATFPNIYRSAVNFSDTVGALRGDTTGGVTTTWTLNNDLPLIEAIDDWQVVSLRFTNSDREISLQTNLQTASGTAGAGSIVGNSIGIPNGSLEVAETLWYRSALSDDDLATTRQYLSNKYGLTISV